MEIKLRYRSIDRVNKVGTFKTLKGAQAFAWKWIGRDAEIGRGYAVSGDGIGKITVIQGTTLVELFPQPELLPAWPGYLSYEQMQADPGIDEDAAAGIWTPRRWPGCSCSPEQLARVGCDCSVLTDSLTPPTQTAPVADEEMEMPF